MIRISEADYGAAMSEHQKYIREAERLGPIWAELRNRRAQADADKPTQGRSFVSAQVSSVGSFLSTSLHIRRVSEQQSAS
jgi:hypothetical protein